MDSPYAGGCEKRRPSKTNVTGTPQQPIELSDDDDDDNGVTAGRATRRGPSGRGLRGKTKKKRGKSTDQMPSDQEDSDDDGKLCHNGVNPYSDKQLTSQARVKSVLSLSRTR